MVENLTVEERSRIMSRIRSKDTKPEMTVRRLLHGLGYRYRLHRSDLPGRPDLTFPSRQKVIFVNGCFWHNHQGCKNVRVPSSNRDYWLAKLERNRSRDKRNLSLLKKDGWSPMTVWECELSDLKALKAKLIVFLESTNCLVGLFLFPGTPLFARARERRYRRRWKCHRIGSRESHPLWTCARRRPPFPRRRQYQPVLSTLGPLQLPSFDSFQAQGVLPVFSQDARSAYQHTDSTIRVGTNLAIVLQLADPGCCR